MKDHVPITKALLFRLSQAQGRIREAEAAVKHAQEIHQTLIDGYLLANDCIGRWEMLEDASAFVLRPDPPLAEGPAEESPGS